MTEQKRTFNEFLDNEIAQSQGENRPIHRRMGICFKRVLDKPKKQQILTYNLDPVNNGVKGGWSSEKIYFECHEKKLSNGKSYHDSVWGYASGGMRVPRGDFYHDGGPYLPPEYRANHVNMHAYNAGRDADDPKLCGIDWDASDNLSDVPEVWQSLPYTRSRSGKFHFYCFVCDVPPTEVRTQARLFKSDCWNNGVVDDKAVDLFIHQKFCMYEIDGTEFFNYTGKLPVLDFAELLEPYMIMEKWTKPPRVSLDRQKSIDPSDKSFVQTCAGDPPEKEEVVLLLECIDPQRGRFDGWLNIGNFLKFTCEFDTATARMLMYDDWSKGEWLYKERVHNYNADRMPKFEWDGIADDLDFDIDYLRKLARQTDWGREKYDAFVKKACVKFALSNDNFDRTPHFGEKHVAQLMKQMLPLHVFDDLQKDTTSALFRQNEGGIFTVVSATEMILEVMGSVTEFLELTLKPAIARRAVEIAALLEQLEEGSAPKTKAEKEAVYLCGLKDDKGKVLKDGMLQRLEKQIMKLQDGPACLRVVTLFRHLCMYRGPRGEPLPDMWNGGPANATAEWLFPFQNGVVDLKMAGEIQFRPARFEEMIKDNSGRFYQPAKREGGDPDIFPGGDIKKWVLDEIWNIYADDHQVMIKLIITASSLRGRNFFQMFVIESGSGGNGKGTMWKLIRRTFGKLCMELNALAIQKEPNDPAAATSYLHRLRTCRKVGVKEPKAGEKIMVATVKKLTGGDAVPCRGLYENETEMVPQFPLEMQCNARPALDESSLQREEKKAMDRRTCFIINPFEFDDLDNPNSKPSSNTPNIFDSDEDVWNAFFEILVTVFDRFVRPFFDNGVAQIKQVAKLGMGIEYPVYWEQCLEEYKKGQDTVQQFMAESYVNMLPPSFGDNMKGADFNPTNMGHLKSIGAYKWAFDDSKSIDQGGSTSVKLEPLYEEYKMFCRNQKEKFKAPKMFMERIRGLGYGITQFDAQGARMERKIYRVFGLGDPESTPDVDLSKSPFDVSMSPSKGPGSFYDIILNDQPIKLDGGDKQLLAVPAPTAVEPGMDEIDIDKMLGEMVVDGGDADDLIEDMDAEILVSDTACALKPSESTESDVFSDNDGLL